MLISFFECAKGQNTCWLQTRLCTCRITPTSHGFCFLFLLTLCPDSFLAPFTYSLQSRNILFIFEVFHLDALANTIWLPDPHTILLEREVIVSCNTWNRIVPNGCWQFAGVDFANCHPSAGNNWWRFKCYFYVFCRFNITVFCYIICQTLLAWRDFVVAVVLSSLGIRKIVTYNLYTSKFTCRVNCW